MKIPLPRLSSLLMVPSALLLLIAAASGPLSAQSSAARIIGVEYPLDRWSPAELEARLQRNQREREQFVRKHLRGTGDAKRLVEQPSPADAQEFLASSELRQLLRLQLQECALRGLRAAHVSCDGLRKREAEWMVSLERLERDGVDTREQVRLRSGLEKLRSQIQTASKVMLAGAVGQPPLGESKPATFVAIESSGDYAQISSLLKWPSAIGQLRLGDPAKPDYRQRMLLQHAESMAKTYSDSLAAARSEQQEYFRDCMELAKSIADLARAGNYRGIDEAREDWILATLGGLLEPLPAEPKPEPAAIVAPPPASGPAAAQRLGLQDYKDGLAEVVDLDTLSVQFLEGRRSVAEQRVNELQAIPAPTVEHVRELRTMLAHIQLAQDLKRKVDERERMRTEFAKVQQRARSQAELGLAPGAADEREIKRLESLLAEGRLAVWSRTCTRALKDELLRDQRHFLSFNMRPPTQLGLVQVRIDDLGLLCYPTHMGSVSGGRRTGPVGGFARYLEEAAVQAYQLPEESHKQIGKWLAEESKFYVQLADDLADLDQRIRGNKEHRELAGRIDRELRDRRNALLTGFFDSLPH